ncbi:MAG: DUF1800 family protein [Pseudomonadota bacterium]
MFRIFFALIIMLALSACGGGSGSDDSGSSSGGSSSGSSSSGGGTTSPISDIPLGDLNAASRFLSQSGFGGSLAEIEEVATLGHVTWLDQQLDMTPSLHTAEALQNHAAYCASINDDDCAGEGVIWHTDFRRFVLLNRVINAPDVVAQKVAYALSQIFVVSDVPDNLNTLNAMVYWWDLLLENGLGNFRDLLEAVTLSPAMGVYLSHYTNGKGDPANGVFPDENYAREIMQLFSIGLYELNPNGTRKKDANGNDIPTYTNEDIREFAKIFTGLANGCGDQQFFEVWAQPAFECPMKMYEEHHASGTKSLLNGMVVPDGQTGMQDIAAAMDNLYNHPNVGPFIGRLLIQRLVKSNPSPAYIARVSAAFADNGAGVRGDMKAFVRAILLDPEATEQNQSSGKLRDPFLRFAHVSRALEMTSSSGVYYDNGWYLHELMKQYPLHSPSVFNFYSPDHVPFGEAGDAGLVSPELQIATSFSLPNYHNMISGFVLWDWQGEMTWVVDEDFELNFAPVYQYQDNPETVIHYVDAVFTHGAMSEATKQGIREAFTDMPWDSELATRTAIVMAMISPEYLVRQ